MIFSNHNVHAQLQRAIKAQIQSYFIGVLVNESSLCDYAELKKLSAYRGGYSYDTLCIMQKNIDAIKSIYPKHYADFRNEFLHQISNPKNESKFSICDRYIKVFSKIEIFDENSVYNAYREFCGGYDDRY